MLIENTLFGIEDKVAIALDMLRTFEPPEGYYVAYSGGKDSTVILDLVRRSGVKYDAHYNRTTVDPPELVRFIRLQPDVIENHPEMSMWDLIIKNRFPPTNMARYCCRVLKEDHHGAGRLIITGVRADESVKRSKRRQIETCYKDDKKSFLHIIFHWSTEEVWEYIHGREIPYCSLYDEGFKRLGCICCPLGGPKNQLIEAERCPKYKALYIKAFQRMLDKKIADGLNVGAWTSGEDVWEWWTTGGKKDPDCEGQVYMFDD